MTRAIISDTLGQVTNAVQDSRESIALSRDLFSSNGGLSVQFALRLYSTTADSDFLVTPSGFVLPEPLV